MPFSTEMILSSTVGFLAGCFVTMLIAMLINHLQRKKQEKSSQQRHHVVSSIGRLCSSIENAFSSYRVGVMNYENLRDVLLEKVDQINTTLNTNIDILDSYYIKNIERFIVDQKCFLLHDEKDKPATTTGESRRGISRAILQDIDQLGKAEAVEPPAAKTPAAKAVTRGATIAQDSAAPAPAAVVEKTVDIELNIPVREPEKEKEMPKPEEAKVREEARVDRKRKPEPVIPPAPRMEVPPPPPQKKKEEDARSEVLSAFEDGATARFSLDTIKQYTESEESAELKEEPVLDTVTDFEVNYKKEERPPFSFDEAMGEQKFSETEAPLRSSADVDATQIYNIQDLLEKTKKREDKKSAKERGKEKSRPGPVTPETGEDTDGFFDIKLPKMPMPEKTAQEEKRLSREDDLVTGDDIADQLDNMFGPRK